MPRQPRIDYEGAIYHVMSREDRREDIVRGDVDRQCTHTQGSVRALLQNSKAEFIKHFIPLTLLSVFQKSLIFLTFLHQCTD